MNIVRRWYYSIRDNRVMCFMIQPRHPYKALCLRYRKWRVNRSLRVLDALDWHMRQLGWTRKERRRFWREFIKKQEYRTDVFNQLTQQ